MGSFRRTSSMNAATDKPKDMPMASTPTFRLASPNQRPASAIVILANSGIRGIRTYTIDIEVVTFAERTHRPTDAAMSRKYLIMGSLHNPKTMMAADVTPTLIRSDMCISTRAQLENA